MAIKSNFTGRKVPSLSTAKSKPVTTNFAKGIYTYRPNDTMDSTEIRLAQDARFDRVGEYGTRLGYKMLMEPMGKVITYDNRSSAPAAYTTSNHITPVTFTASSDFTLCSVKVWPFLVSQGVYSVGAVTVYVDGAKVTESYFLNDSYQSAQQKEVYFLDAPTISNGSTVKIEFTATRGDATQLGVRVNPGTTTPYMVLHSCRAGGIGNVFESNINGIKTIFYTHAGSLWRYSDGGVATLVRNLPAGVTKVRFNQNLNTVRYVDGAEAPHLLTPTISGGAITTWTDSAIPVKDLQTDTTLSVQMSNIMNGTADNLMYFAVDPDTEALWTYPYGYTYAKSPAFSTTATINGSPGTTLSINSSTITPAGIAVGDWITGQGTATAEVTSISGTTVYLKIVDTTPQTISSYDKFSTDFYQNFPAIKTGDPLTAMFNLGGVLYFMTRRNKYQMYAQAADSWTQSSTNAQNGTFSQESVVCDLNYAYFASDNGVYVFNGSSETSLTESSIQNVYDAIPNKEQIVVDLFKNRLYVYYPSTKTGANDRCLVYNINLHVWESFDTNAFVSATSARQNSSSRFICGHSKIGALLLNENTENNDYSDVGQAINFNIETAYQHFGTTSQQKRISKWRPQFATVDNPYTVECGYALDYTDQVKYAFSIDLQRQVPALINYVWDNPPDYGVPAIPTVHTTSTKVNGEFYRCQIRYQHIAAFEPVIFRSHTLTVETQRIR